MRFPDDTFLTSMGDEEIRVDEFRKDGQLVVRAEAPGIDPSKDVELSMQEGRLFLQVQRRKETKVEDKDYVREEMRYGQFTRSLPLPPGCTEKDIKATYENGILEIHVPLNGSQPKRIPVSSK